MICGLPPALRGRIHGLRQWTSWRSTLPGIRPMVERCDSAHSVCSKSWLGSPVADSSLGHGAIHTEDIRDPFGSHDLMCRADMNRMAMPHQDDLITP